jgi:hypothetical protein
MRNMLQLLGGVAVAGAVAAGSTAFTAAGLSAGSIATSAGYIGGQVSVNTQGASLTDLTFTQAASVSGANKVTAAVLTFDNATPSGATVTLVATGATWGPTTGDSNNAADGFYCGAVATVVVNAQNKQRATCTIGTSVSNNTGSATTITSVNVTVV